MGYSSQSKDYKLWDVESQKYIVPRDVKFNESSVTKLVLSPTLDSDTPMAPQRAYSRGKFRFFSDNDRNARKYRPEHSSRQF